MSGQRARSAVAADHRSVHPNLPGLPWWGAVLLAATATAIGFAFDAGSGDRELGSVFAGCYVIGCVLAVLGVRQGALFTAVIQPPLLLFVSVPCAYFLFHSSEVKGLKEAAINCGYPLIERFPLMFFTSAAVLLIGLGRWYVGMSSKRHTTAAAGTTGAPHTGLLSSLTAKVAAMLPARSEADAESVSEEKPRRRRATDKPRRRTGTSTTRAERRPTKRATPSRSRHARPETEIIEPVVDRPRRSRSTRTPAESPKPATEQRRRSRSTEPRKSQPIDRRSTYERPERRRRYDDFDDYGSPEGRPNGNSTHHPVSRVRYRSADDGEARSEYRTSPRHRSREYDS